MRARSEESISEKKKNLDLSRIPNLFVPHYVTQVDLRIPKNLTFKNLLKIVGGDTFKVDFRSK